MSARIDESFMLDDLIGTVYGPFSFRTTADRVDALVEATGDDQNRWDRFAPPSLAGALLFVVTPHLLADPGVGDIAGSVIHGDQSFVWHRPIPLETDLVITGTITKARERGGVIFLGFDLGVSADGSILEGSSTFLMSGGAPPAGGSQEQVEPGALAGSELTPVMLAAPPAVGEEIAPVARSVSRADLVRYAAASGDFNPIHWDHAAAVRAGLPGVVVHGLLQSAWLTQVASSLVPGTRPLAEAKFRYRAPLRPAVDTRVLGSRVDENRFDLRLDGGGTTFVTGTIIGSDR